jgi:D-aspartate ligase
VGGVVIGGEYHGLAIVRSLGRRGIPTCVIDDEYSIAQFSRYATFAVRVPRLRAEEETLECLLTLAKRHHVRGWVLYPTRDETVGALSRQYDRLASVFRLSTPKWDAAKWAWDKRKTYELARSCGIPTPRTRYPRDEAELTEFDLPFPVVVKPAIKEHFVYATKAKAWFARNTSELRQRFSEACELVGPGEVMIQEWIPGDGGHQFAFCSFFKNRSPLAGMTVRRLRQHPLDFGRASTYVETIDLPELEQLSTRLLRAINFYGLSELEYKYDARDGHYKLLDFNARCWGYHSLGANAGTDFPRLIFEDLCERPPSPRRAAAGIRWIRLITDVPTGLLEIRRGRIRPAEYVRSVMTCDVESVFTREDWLPAVAEIALIPYLIYKRGF